MGLHKYSITLLNFLGGQLHEKDVQRLNLWQYIITLGRKEIFVELALQGMEDMKHLGLFFNKSFPKLINTGKPAEMFIVSIYIYFVVSYDLLCFITNFAYSINHLMLNELMKALSISPTPIQIKRHGIRPRTI